MRLKTPLIIAGAGVALYAAAGFLIAPAIIKPRLVEGISRATHRSVELGDLHVNPFALSVDLEHFTLRDRDSSVLVSFRELYVNYEIRSLFQNAFVFSAFRLDTPLVSLRVLRDGRSSIHDLFEGSPPDTARSAEPARGLVIDNLWINGGRIGYLNLSRPEPVVKMIDSIDLSLKNFTTWPQEGGDYEFEAVTRQNEKLHWKGIVSLGPLHSSGTFELSNLRTRTLWDFAGDRLNYRMDSGTLNLKGEYRYDGGEKTPRFSLSNGALDAYSLVLTTPEDSIAPVALPAVHVKEIAYASPPGALTIGEARVEGGSIRTALLEDGTLTIQKLLTPRASAEDTVPSHMTVVVKTLRTSGVSFVLTDRMKEPEAAIALSAIDIAMDNLVYGTQGEARLQGSAVLNGAGSLKIGGTMSLLPQKAELDIALAGSPLAGLQPYVSRYSRAIFASGTYGAKGKLSYADRGASMLLRFRGSASSDGGRIDDPVLHEDLTRWDHMEMRRVDYQYDPPRLSIGEIAATRPYARVIVSPDRRINVQNVVAAEGDSTRPVEKVKTPEEVKAARGKETKTTIGSVVIKDGAMNFTDLSLTPTFVIGILGMEGTITGLSSDEISSAQVELNGKVDKYAPVAIRGTINPLTDNASSDILMKFEGIELTTFTPYFSKFAGYKIERGKMSMDLRYKLNKRFLEAENKIVFNKLTLGEKVESPDATSLPVKLAIALLKDSKGNIDLDVPVSGSLDDPEFSVFPIILKALLNLLWKIVTAPFALLGSLFGGGGEDLQFTAFLPGSDSLAADQQAKLTSVAKGLAERPELQLDLRGTASPLADRDAIAELSVMKSIRPDGKTGRLTAEEGEKLLGLYRKTFREDPVLPAGSLPGNRDSLLLAAAKSRLMDSVRVGEDDLRDLARRRSAAIMQFLTASGGIPPERIYLQEVETTSAVAEGKVRAVLTLTAK